ncbi:MAG: hypothetical protein JOY62_07265 [Acidobacteriaceae bacterium]|nr:hypothetical protein [Acidobacteriaceae bacterium]MBV9779757.1 hypothetical protein [Acidobacteriaceae bacterium]
MAVDLETLKTQIEDYLQEVGVAVFHGRSRIIDSPLQVYWDVSAHPNFREFIEAGRKAGAKLVVFAHQAFSLDEIDEALDQLEDSKLGWEEKHNFETRLRELQSYEGFTCLVELSFDIDSRIYIYEMRTEWYQSLTDIIAELDAAAELEEDEDQGPMPGYFSRN